MKMDKIAVIIPCYKVKNKILDVISSIPKQVALIYVVDDLCPEGSGNHIQNNVLDKRVKVIFNKQNLGVGGAVIQGYKAAIDEGCGIVVKVDGDGQMSGGLIPEFVKPILEKRADYVKGNRFFSPEDLRTMPFVRLVGNSVLSLINKFVNGY